MVRCTDPDPVTGLQTEIPIDCSELVEGGTCAQVAVGGEAPGPTCTVEASDCTNAFAEGFACDPDQGILSVCLYGRIQQVRCADVGLSTCIEDGSFFNRVRCIP